MHFNKNEILSRIDRVGKSISILEKSINATQRKIDERMDAYSTVVNDRLEKLEKAMLRLQATAYENQSKLHVTNKYLLFYYKYSMLHS